MKKAPAEAPVLLTADRAPVLQKKAVPPAVQEVSPLPALKPQAPAARFENSFAGASDRPEAADPAPAAHAGPKREKDITPPASSVAENTSGQKRRAPAGKSSPVAAGPEIHAVTGAFGFTGAYVARRLLDAGHRVVTLTSAPERPHNLGSRIEARPYAFKDVSAMAASLEGVSVLYNTYWVRFNHPPFSYADAVRNTLVLFEAARKAGVRRIVHVSITNADSASPLEYFSGKGHLENALKAFGVSHAIVRPAVLFGAEGILVNNIAWALRTFPFFGLFGDGRYRLQPVSVEDMADLLIEQGKGQENVTVNALGPEVFQFRDLVDLVATAIGKRRPVLPLPPKAGVFAAWCIGRLIGDVFLTKDEIEGLMANLLYVPDAEPTGASRLSEWIWENRHTLGTRYYSELDRRLSR